MPPPLRLGPALPLAHFFFFLTFQLSLAGVGSTFPATSLARTSKLCLPFFTFSVSGEVHAWKGPSSSLHSNVEPASVEVNSKVAVFFFVLSLGCFVIWVSGGVVSPGCSPPGPGCSPPPPGGGWTTSKAFQSSLPVVPSLARKNSVPLTLASFCG